MAEGILLRLLKNGKQVGFEFRNGDSIYHGKTKSEAKRCEYSIFKTSKSYVEYSHCGDFTEVVRHPFYIKHDSIEIVD